MKIILINPYARNVNEVDVDINSIEAILETLSEPGQPPVDILDVVHPHKGIILFVDDVALLQETLPPVFMMFGYHHIIAGRALVAGVDAYGETLPSPWSAEFVRSIVVFEKRS